MDNIFIGWSGNKSLAESIAKIINIRTKHKAIIGGGEPKDMFIGAQVLRQIDQSNYAVLLVEDKTDSQISSNLMFEWGYIMAKMPLNNICTVLINKSPRDLPSDLLGTWVFEVYYEKENYNEEILSNQIFNIIEKAFGSNTSMNYFDLIDRWNQVFSRLKANQYINETEKVEYLLMGCLAAYYYMDNVPFRNVLNTFSGNVTTNEVVAFAKSYVDLFIESANMTIPISQDTFFRLMQTFETTQSRHKNLPNELDTLLDILCNDAYGLSCSLFLANCGLDQETIEFFSNKALTCYNNALKEIEIFHKKHNCPCLYLLLNSYLNNDLGHLYQKIFDDQEKYRNLLQLSIDNRKKLHQTFASLYPNNVFLITKFEQEYIIALSEQCNYMENSFMKTMYEKMIISKFNEWQKELIYTSSLTDRIAANIKKIK